MVAVNTMSKNDDNPLKFIQKLLSDLSLVVEHSFGFHNFRC
ncbi:conserved hypothetical protein [delta proteobacterium NaphS2]|nr:conserved hypothetical protein [delta proteobacterium NaphS2]